MGKGRDKKKKSRGSESKAKRAKDKTDPADEDIDKLLEDYVSEVAEKNKTTVGDETILHPSPRANASVVLNPLNSSEIFMFGGEYSNGEKVLYYSDLYKFNPEKLTWKKITAGISPKPRSSHQMSACSNGKLLLFGGEFGTPKDTKFLHHRDCWLLDPKSLLWEEVPGKHPSPRSGHRMASWRNFVVLFGGFYDDGKQTRYLDDLWVFDCKSYTWTELHVKGERPSARSGFVFVACDDGVMLYGGYQVVKDSKGDFNGKCLNDLWKLHIMNDSIDQSRWEKVKLTNSIGVRGGCSACTVKNNLVLFGGIIDEHVSDEYIHGVCQNDVHSLDLTNLSSWRKVDCDGALPLGRFNAMMLSSSKNIFVFGGIFESGDVDIYLDDIWTLHCGSHYSWICIKALTSKIPETCDSGIEAESDVSSTTSSETSSSDSCSSDSEMDYEYPRPTAEETLKEYYQRCQSVFLNSAHEKVANADEKSLRKDAFILAETFFNQFKMM